MKFLVRLSLSLAVAAAAAYISVGYMLDRQARPIAVGPWTTSLTVGSAKAGPYLRARIARHGIWALDSSEVIYYTTNTDSRGFPLSHNAVYRIEGGDLDTRWWSITAYNDDHFIPNRLDRYSFSQTTIEPELGGTWIIRLSKVEVPGNWLPSGDLSGNLVLTLRCYNPGRRMIDDPGSARVPQIVRESGS
jgi:hypothetical protein